MHTQEKEREKDEVWVCLKGKSLIASLTARWERDKWGGLVWLRQGWFVESTVAEEMNSWIPESLDFCAAAAAPTAPAGSAKPWNTTGEGTEQELTREEPRVERRSLTDERRVTDGNCTKCKSRGSLQNQGRSSCSMNQCENVAGKINTSPFPRDWVCYNGPKHLTVPQALGLLNWTTLSKGLRWNKAKLDMTCSILVKHAFFSQNETIL